MLDSYTFKNSFSHSFFLRMGTRKCVRMGLRAHLAAHVSFAHSMSTRKCARIEHFFFLVLSLCYVTRSTLAKNSIFSRFVARRLHLVLVDMAK